jgi:Cd2+/Zn2+-exporting ATPase
METSLKENKKLSQEFTVKGMDCADCALHVEKSVSKLSGITSAQVNFMSGKMVISLDTEPVDFNEIAEAVKSAGYEIDESSSTVTRTFTLKNLQRTNEKLLRKRLKTRSSVRKFKIDYPGKKINITYEAIDKDFQEIFDELGLKAVLAEEDGMSKPKTISENMKSLIFTATSGVLAVAGLVLEQFGYFAEWMPFVYLAAIIIGGHSIARQGYKEARQLRLGMNFLMSIAIIGAFIIGEYSEAAIVVFLFSLAELLESLTIQRARRSLESLMNLTPEIALLKTGNSFIEKSVHDIKIGDILLVKPGQRIPLDGNVIEGHSSVNQAPITGESLPVEKTSGDLVYAGSLNENGSLQISVTHQYDDSTLARIIQLVEKAQLQRAPVQQIVEKFAAYYTPAVVIISVLILLIPTLFLGGEFHTWFYRALVLLVISCPCALVISTPVTLISALTNAFRNGILIKGSSYLENFTKLKVLAFDKTGTLTYGNPSVTDLIPMNGHQKADILRIALTLELHSEHALADAIVRYARTNNADSLTAEKFRVYAGKGAMATIGGEKYYVGNHRFFQEKGWCDEKVHIQLRKIEESRQTAVILSKENEITGIFAIADEIRPESASVLQKLKGLGFLKLMMLTGDNRLTAEAIAKELNIDEYFAELLPEDKVSTIHQIKESYRYVGMIGDGINDAPALAAANIGISMGASGSDIAMETADISLMTDNLNDLTYLKRLSKKAVQIIKQNIFISIFLKAIFFALAIPGLATLWMAVFADMGASLIVIFNGLRALNLKKTAEISH